MKQLPVMRAGAVVIGLACLTPAVPAFSLDQDCTVERPDEPGDGRASDGAPSTGKTLSQQLATCGSVLDPPSVGDPDIVEPAPKTNDPINIHPGAPYGTRP